MGVTYDTRQLDRRLAKMEREFGKAGLSTIADTATRELERVTRGAFRGKFDPATFRPWPLRKGGQPWPALERTGTLADALGFGSKTLKWVAFSKASIEAVAVPHPTDKVRTYQNLAHVLFHGRDDMAGRPFFYRKGSTPPASFTAKVLRRARQVAARAARG